MGIRDRDGKKDATMKRQLLYNLVKPKEQTWENAMDIASRWELADYEDAGKKRGEVEEEKESSSGDDGDNDGVKAVEVVKSKKSKKGKVSKKDNSISAFSDEIEENRERILNLEMAQARLEEEFKGLKVSQDTMTGRINNISAKLDMFFSQFEEENTDTGGASAW